jgi:hypothetical protein
MMPLSLRFGARCCTLLLVIAGAAPHVAGADASTKSMMAARTPTPPAIDGRLDDTVWGLAQPDDRFTQRFPRDGAAPAHRTTVRVLYDDSAVYVGMRMDDDEADKIVARLARRDHPVESDFVTVALDSHHDHSTGYFFTLNAAGVQFDGTFYNDSSMTYDWDAVWDGIVSRDAGGWSAEFKIPLSVLRFPDTTVQEWGIQAERYLSRTQENDRWSYTPQDVAAIVSPLGHLTGLAGLRPRRTLELLPFTVARLRIHSDSGGAFLGLGASQDAQVTPEATLGLDAKIGLTSNLTLDATVNPDFGQVEADEVVLNLSRFETFFPEKRPFFLEGGDLFRTDLGQFYSRRIGRGLSVPSSIDDGGTVFTVRELPPPVPIRAALKVTGKLAGDVSIGVLDAITAPEDVTVTDNTTGDTRKLHFAPYMNYALLRTKYVVQGASYLGFLATAATRLDGHWRNASEDHDGYSQGIDGAWQSDDSRWRVTGDATLSERVGGTSGQTDLGRPCPSTTDGCIPLSRPDGTLQRPGDVGWGVLSTLTHTGIHWDLFIDYRALSPRLDLNDLGFLPDFNLQGGFASLTYQQREPRGSVQNWSLGAGFEEQATFDNVVTAQNSGLFGALRFTNFWNLKGAVGYGLPGRWDVSETGDGARLQRPPSLSGNLVLQSDPRSKAQFLGGVSYYRRLGEPGWMSTASSQLTFNVIPTLQLDVSSEVNLSAQVPRLWFPDGCRDDAGDVCTPLSVTRHYIFGQLKSGSISFTSHAAYTFSPRLSLQGYAQLFMARGGFTSYARLDPPPGVHPQLRLDDLQPRLRLDDLRPHPALPPDVRDGAGDFQRVALNLNLVLRWEFLSGSALLVVYSRTQSGNSLLAGSLPRFTAGGLSDGPTEDVFLIKLSYFVR